MKTKFYLFSVLLLLLSFFANAQKSIKTSGSCNSCKEKSVQKIEVIYKCSEYLNFPKNFVNKFDNHLIITESIAQYQYHRKMRIVREGRYQVSIGEHNYINNYYLKDKIMEELRILKNGEIKAKWKPEYKWKITKETKTINGYKAYKAIANSIEIDPDDPAYKGKVFAWFTKEIPIPAGPGRYVGLPGLILEISYEKSPVKIKMKNIIFNSKQELIDISKRGILLEDKNDVIYYFHNNPKTVKKALKAYKK